MMKISKTVEYALRALLQLAKADGSKPIPCSRLAKLGNIPERFLLQILRSMVTRGVLQSTRGAEGGYALTRAAAEISLLDVIEAIDGPLEPQLSLGEGIDELGIAKLRETLTQMVNSTRAQLDIVKISDLLPKRTDNAAKNSIPASHQRSVGGIRSTEELSAPSYE